MGHYNPPPLSSASSVVLLVLGIVSTICTICAVVAMLRLGTRSKLSELTACINAAMTVWTISSLPFVYEHYHMCAVFGFALWYSIVQLVIAASLMMYGAKEYIAELQSNQESMGDGESLTLSNTERILLYIFPIIPPVFPLSTSSFGHMYCWCTIDFDAKFGGASFFLLMIVCWVPVIFVVHQYFRVSAKVETSLTSSELFYQVVLNGPVMYGSATIVLFLSAAIYNFIASLCYRRQSAESIYYGQYVFELLVSLLGISYGLICARNYENVKVCFFRLGMK